MGGRRAARALGAAACNDRCSEGRGLPASRCGPAAGYACRLLAATAAVGLNVVLGEEGGAGAEAGGELPSTLWGPTCDSADYVCKDIR